jgi:hypothetical protein
MGWHGNQERIRLFRYWGNGQVAGFERGSTTMVRKPGSWMWISPF